MQAQRVERDAFGKARGDAGGEIAEHVLARRLVAHRNHIAEAFGEHAEKFLPGFRGAQHQRMVETRDDLLADDPFQYAEIQHHAAFRVGRIFGRSTLNRYKQTVGVPVNLAARTVVSVERMSRLERKFFSQSDNCHIAKIV